MSRMCRVNFGYLSRRVCFILSGVSWENHPPTSSGWPELSRKGESVLGLIREPDTAETEKASRYGLNPPGKGPSEP